MADRDAKTFDDSTEWRRWLHERLSIPEAPGDAPLALDLFAGCGGLALGFEAAGFRTLGYEMRAPFAETYERNLAGACRAEKLAPGVPDVSADVIVGGPPCQPFSQTGRQRGVADHRNGFPAFLDAVARIRPKLAIIENVRGLMFKNKPYLNQATETLRSLGYEVDVRLLDASRYGVPQKRQRVFVVASPPGWEWPDPVVDDPVTAGTALGDSAFEADDSHTYLTESMNRYIAAYEAKSKCARPRDLHLDKPARTLTCRNLAGATADMHRIKLPDGRRRMLTLAESKRLQGFPDWFEFAGSPYERYEQVGNAVPPLLARAMADRARRCVG